MEGLDILITFGGEPELFQDTLVFRGLLDLPTRDLALNQLRVNLDSTQCVADLKRRLAEQQGKCSSTVFRVVVNGEDISDSMTIADLRVLADTSRTVIYCWPIAESVPPAHPPSAVKTLDDSPCTPAIDSTTVVVLKVSRGGDLRRISVEPGSFSFQDLHLKFGLIFEDFPSKFSVQYERNFQSGDKGGIITVSNSGKNCTPFSYETCLF
jgi:hypothetical protein